ncbi:MAG TPA: hypothetical protein VIB08_06310 [Thermoanaerobaculia bacterium]
MLERFPVFKKAFANQYQAILLAGAAAFSAVTMSPLPVILLLGAEMMVMPFLFERLKRRIEIEKKYAGRQFETISVDDQLKELPPASRERFERLRRLCDRIQQNYRGLSPESQGVLAEQSAKFEAILASCLRRLWLLKKYEELTAGFPESQIEAEIRKLRDEVETSNANARVREARQQNLQIKEKLLETVRRNAVSRTALQAELDSLESLLQLLYQKSVATTDAEAFSLEIDDVLAQAEIDAASVQEMEQLLGAMPDRAASVSDAIRRPLAADAAEALAPKRVRDALRKGRS